MSKSATFRFFLPMVIGLLIGLFFSIPPQLPDRLHEWISCLNAPAFILFCIFTGTGIESELAFDCLIVLQWLLLGSFAGLSWLTLVKTKGARSYQRLARNIIGITVVIPSVATISLMGYARHTSVYFGFKHKSATYHAQFAEACDIVMAQHPLGTNNVIEISTSDPSVPKIISDLYPLKIGVTPNRVWVWVKDSHVDGLAVSWEPLNVNQTNNWALTITDGDGPEVAVYFGNHTLDPSTAKLDE